MITLPLKIWDWYMRFQGHGDADLCPVPGHKQIWNHSIFRLTLCALKKGIVTMDQLRQHNPRSAAGVERLNR